VENFQNFDFFFLHVKGADNASHDGNLEGKMAMVKKLDSMVKFLLNNLNLEETVIALTSDHTTPLSMRNHSGDPVPLTIAGWGVLADDVNQFSEKACAKGGLGRIRGKDLMPILMNLVGRLKKFGV
jgi:2,3-bisphosphoglycerate-independent phosphoglycerate mutase